MRTGKVNSKRVSHGHLHFGKDSKSGRGMGKLCSGEEGRLQVPWLEARGRGRLQAAKQGSYVTARSTNSAFSGGSSVGSRDKNQGRCQLLTKSWLFCANCFGGYCLACWTSCRDSGLTSCKSDLQVAGWLPGLVSASCGSEFNFQYGLAIVRLHLQSLSQQSLHIQKSTQSVSVQFNERLSVTTTRGPPSNFKFCRIFALETRGQGTF